MRKLRTGYNQSTNDATSCQKRGEGFKDFDVPVERVLNERAYPVMENYSQT